MIKQKYGNGYWIGLTVGVCPRCFSSYHFVPVGFVMALIFCLVMALCGNKMLFIILSLLYGIVNVGMSILTVLKEKKKIFALFVVTVYIYIPSCFLWYRNNYWIVEDA